MTRRPGQTVGDHGIEGWWGSAGWLQCGTSKRGLSQNAAYTQDIGMIFKIETPYLVHSSCFATAPFVFASVYR